MRAAKRSLEIKRRETHIHAMDTPPRKIDQLVSDEILKMAREQRNKLRVAQLKLH
jgi:hypothetical protein